jgi:cell division protease FtsH
MTPVPVDEKAGLTAQVATAGREPCPELEVPRMTSSSERRRPQPFKRYGPHAGKIITLVVLVGCLGGSLLFGESESPPGPEVAPLSTVVGAIEQGEVTSAELVEGDNTVNVTLDDGSALAATYPYAYSDSLTKLLLRHDVLVESTPAKPPSLVGRILLSLLPILILVGVLVWLVRSRVLTGGIGKFSGKRGQQIGQVPDDRFSDVAGCDEAIDDLKELVEFLTSPDRFTALGAKAPRGGLLVGPPGTGKTLLARAVAGEAQLPFFALAGSDFVETFAGVGAKRARDLFDRARKLGGAIIFIDEIDAVGRTRSNGPSHGGESERENTLIALLSEMDGFASDARIVVLAATNRSDVLDPALTRPGRLDRSIQVPAPDRRGREAILAVHTRGKELGVDVDLTVLARRTPGMSGADLAQVVNEACLEAARRSRSVVDSDCFDAALSTVALGRARTSALVTEHDRVITAWHEAGHTVAALAQPDADDPVSVSIVPRGSAGGVTWMSGSDDQFLTRRKAHARLFVAMAGRAGEELLLDGEYTQGAHGDLAAASELAYAMVTQHGMSRLGYAVVSPDTVRMGGPVAERVHLEVDRLLRAAHEEAGALLSAHAGLVRAVAEALLEHEDLSRADLAALVDAPGTARLANDALVHTDPGGF